MRKFNKSSILELKNLLRDSYVHDAKLKKFNYTLGENCIEIELFNPIFNVKLNLTCHGIEAALATKGEWGGSRETVLSLSAEDDFSCLKKLVPTLNNGAEDYLYLLIQTFSGDELHIVSREVNVEIFRDGQIVE